MLAGKTRQAGIAYVSRGAAESIVLNDGCEDDIDEGDALTYTG